MTKGRPTKYKKEYCQLLIDEMAKGYSKEAFCGLIGIHKDTFYEWIKIHKDLSDAMHIGEAKSLHFWEGKGIDGMDKGKDFNALAWKFGIANRHGWKDKQDLTSDDKPIGNPILGGATSNDVSSNNSH